MAETAGNGESAELCDRQRTGIVYGRYACGRDGGAGCGGRGDAGDRDGAVSEDGGLRWEFVRCAVQTLRHSFTIQLLESGEPVEQKIRII